MKKDFSPIAPELRILRRGFPDFSASPTSLFSIRRWMRFLSAARPPSGVHVETRRIQAGEEGYDLPLRIYKPVDAAGRLPALLWIHGGGFIFGTPAADDTGMSLMVRELGIAVVSVDYRLAPEHPFPTPLEDCYAALKWTHDHAAEAGIDPARIAVGGASAGGGLAACLSQLAIDRGEVRPAMQLLVYPMLDDRTVLRQEVPHRELLTWTPESNRYGWEAYLGQPAGMESAPACAVAARRTDLKGLPPAWVGAGTLDLFHEEDKAYAERLKQAGVECEWVEVPGAFHGFDMAGVSIPLVRAFWESQARALRKHLVEI